MNITQESELMTKVYSNDKIDLEEAMRLLKECEYCLNWIKNTKYNGPNYKTSYELVSVISKYLKKKE